MSSRTHIAILMHDTLAAQGLKSIVENQFAATVHVVETEEQLMAQPADWADFIVTDAAHFVSQLPYFLPRQARTIVVAAHQAAPAPAGVTVINPHDDLDSLLTQLGRCLRTDAAAQATATPALSQRETEVLRLIASGKINKEIAGELHISLNTVLTHRKNITSKLDIKSVSGLTFYALMNGLV